jgi:hypothetical protein
MDLSPDTLDFLTHLMCAQARECLFEKNELQLYDDSDDDDKKKKKRSDIDKYLTVGQEAAYVSQIYSFISEKTIPIYFFSQ